MKKIWKLKFFPILSTMLACGVLSAGLVIANTEEKKMQSVVFGAGCFWCVEAAFRLAEGVSEVSVGYTGGSVAKPSYKDVCTGRTGHAEVAKITYDPAKISLEKLFEIFMTVHDPTTPNRQGEDVGTQYRSAVFYNSDSQRDQIKSLLKAAQAGYREKIVTEVAPLGVFYPAEDYHQNYFAQNPEAGYCRAVIAPKVRKVRQLLKPENRQTGD